MLKSGRKLQYSARVPTHGVSLIGWFEFLLTLEPDDGDLQVFVEEKPETME